MRLRKGDEVIAADIARNDADLLVVTENGFGKRTRIDQYPVKGRAGSGSRPSSSRRPAASSPARSWCGRATR